VAVYAAILAAVLLFGGIRLALNPPTGETVKVAVLTTNVNEEQIYLAFPLIVLEMDPAKRPAPERLETNKSVMITPDGEIAYQYVKHNLLIGWEATRRIMGAIMNLTQISALRMRSTLAPHSILKSAAPPSAREMASAKRSRLSHTTSARRPGPAHPSHTALSRHTSGEELWQEPGVPRQVAGDGRFLWRMVAHLLGWLGPLERQMRHAAWRLDRC
jgi:hypothetical protein